MLKVVVAEEGIIYPPAHAGDAGYDLATPDAITAAASDVTLVILPLRVAIPDGCAGFIKPRSSVFSQGIVIEGVIDSGYRGDITLMIYNTTEQDITFEAGQRIAQLVITEVKTPPLLFVDELPPSTRGTGGLGSTGL